MKNNEKDSISKNDPLIILQRALNYAKSALKLNFLRQKMQGVDSKINNIVKRILLIVRCDKIKARD